MNIKELRKEYYRKNLLVLLTLDILTRATFIVLICTMGIGIYFFLDLIVDNRILMIVLSITLSFPVYLYLFGKVFDVQSFFERKFDDIENLEKNKHYKEIFKDHSRMLQIESRLMQNYITPLLNTPYFRVRPTSMLKSTVEQIEDDYLWYINLFCRFRREDATFLYGELSASNPDIETMTNHLGKKVNIFLNYHCLATFHNEDEATEINDFWRTLQKRQSSDRIDPLELTRMTKLSTQSVYEMEKRKERILNLIEAYCDLGNR